MSDGDGGTIPTTPPNIAAYNDRTPAHPRRWAFAWGGGVGCRECFVVNRFLNIIIINLLEADFANEYTSCLKMYKKYPK